MAIMPTMALSAAANCERSAQPRERHEIEAREDRAGNRARRVHRIEQADARAEQVRRVSDDFITSGSVAPIRTVGTIRTVKAIRKRVSVTRARCVGSRGWMAT